MGVLQEKVYIIRITDLNELKQRLSTEWAQLDHVVTRHCDLRQRFRQWRRL